MRHRLSILAACFFLTPVAGLLSADLTNPEQIVEQVVLRDTELQARRKAYDYDLTVVQQSLDSNGRIKESMEKKSVVISDQRPDYFGKLDKNGQNDQPPPKDQPFNILQTISHFNYLLEGKESINGRDCYRVKFFPKPNMPYHSRKEKVMNAVAGHLWVSVQDYSLMQNEGALVHPVEVGWIFATLEEMEFRYESEQLPNGDFGPRKITYRYRVEIPFGQIHDRVIRSMSHYRLSAR